MFTGGVLKTIGFKSGMRSILIQAPADAAKALGLPEDDVSKRLTGSFDYIHLFTKRRKELNAEFLRLKKRMNPGGMLWVSWPKGGGLGADLTLKSVIEIGYNHGLVESKTISIDQTWSAIKFTFPKKGKQYNNSYGKLPGSA